MQQADVHHKIDERQRNEQTDERKANTSPNTTRPKTETTEKNRNHLYYKKSLKAREKQNLPCLMNLSVVEHTGIILSGHFQFNTDCSYITLP